MKKSLILTIAGLMLSALFASAQMTDSQVTDYVKMSLAAGKSESQITRELLAKGVTQQQALRIKNSLESARQEMSRDLTSMTGTVNPRSEIPQNAAPLLDADGNVIPLDQMLQSDHGSVVYGHGIFRNRTLSFEPNENTATPEDYKLGPGDQVIIEIWGYNEASISQVISPEGKINVSQVGPVVLGGLTIKEASAKIKKVLQSKYSGLGGETPNTEVSVTLGNIRSIQVNVMGEVQTPGTYRLSSFSTVFTALYRAGGVTDEGSLRSIKVSRGGKQIADVDVYEYIFDGKSDSDIRLQEGDIIIVPPFVSLVTIRGEVKRPMLYELKGGETVADAIEYAGGFTNSAHRDDILLERNNTAERQVFTVTSSRMGLCPVEDGDVLTASANYEKYANRLEVQGYVFRPGVYQYGSEIRTLKALVAAAGGLREDAFLQRAIINREQEDLTLKTISIPLGDVMSGKVADIPLQKNDVLIISGMYDLQTRGTLTINGLVHNPGVFPFSDDTSIEDLIIRAGGLMEGASLARVDVSRRVYDPNSTMPSDTIGRSYSFSIKDGLVVDGGDEFLLEPFDVVIVRKNPTFQTQQFVTVSGEVAFPGRYAIIDRNETVTDIIARAGGVTNRSYPKGGLLIRRTNDEEATLNSATRRMIHMGMRDTLDVEKMTFTDRYTVGIELDKALQNPKSTYDIALREGDEIVVPEYLNTVRIQGNVMYPNTVLYLPGKSLRYYIDSAGGYGFRAKKSKVYVVYMNGNVTRARSASKIEPGCEIIVPTKDERKEVSIGNILGLGTTTASLATMVATLVRLFN